MEETIKKIKNDIPLSGYSTFRIGGLAKYFIEIKEREELSDSILWALGQNLPYFILAGGSNILVSDSGFNGLVIKMKNDKFGFAGRIINAESGVILAKIVKSAADNNLSGLEWAYGIPGTVGGAVRGNAGAFGGSMQDSVKKVTAYDTSCNRFIEIDNAECRFFYRDSVFKHKSSLVIWQTELLLQRGSGNEIKKRMGEFAARRSKIQPAEPSAGSVFKNLMFKSLTQVNPDLAEQAQKQGVVRKGKVGAGWVIDQLGLKGKSIGGAKISDLHANFIVNTGKAKADDVAMLVSYIKQQVRDKYDIQLHEEISYVGFGMNSDKVS